MIGRIASKNAGIMEIIMAEIHFSISGSGEFLGNTIILFRLSG